jgi:spore coat polysaccharide biosynthesis protein SpsF (cytidylyltransferase family)
MNTASPELKRWRKNERWDAALSVANDKGDAETIFYKDVREHHIITKATSYDDIKYNVRFYRVIKANPKSLIVRICTTELIDIPDAPLQRIRIVDPNDIVVIVH